MSLLQQIQEAVVQEGSDLGSILLKLRLLASKLGSDVLEEWVKYESEGYPDNADVPPYRIIDVTYRGTFSGSLGSGIQNAQIPPFLIEKYAGKSWTKKQVRNSISAVEEMIKKSAEGDSLGIDASNLILLLQGNVYEGYACNDVSGTISPTSFSEIRNTVRNKILELTIQLEKSVPGALQISFGVTNSDKAETEQVQHLSQQIIYGNVSNAVMSANDSKVKVEINQDDSKSLIDFLVQKGIDLDDANELAKIVETESPTNSDEPFGEKTKKWLGSNLKKATEGTWKIGVSIATQVITEGLQKYYGLS